MVAELLPILQVRKIKRYKKWYQKCEEVYYIFDKCIPIILSSDSTDFSTLLNSLGNYSYHSGLDVG